MVLRFKWVIQLLFLMGFIIATIIGRVQLWMFIFIGSVIGAVLLGRFYCGWICPINTLTDGINWVYKRKKIKRRELPDWMKKLIIRYGILILFIGMMIFTLRTGRKLPVLPILVVLGSLSTLFFVPSLWHRYLCPYGAILNLTGSLARHYWRVDTDNCVECGACKRVCPGEAIKTDGVNSIPEINKGLCLECTACVKECPQNSIKYI